MRREVVFTQDGNVMLKDSDTHKQTFSVFVNLEKEANETQRNFDKRCIKEGTKNIVKRYFSLKRYIDKETI